MTAVERETAVDTVRQVADRLSSLRYVGLLPSDVRDTIRGAARDLDDAHAVLSATDHAGV